MANEKNLTPVEEIPPEIRSKNGKKGAAAAHEAARRNKTFKEAVMWALDLPAFTGNATVEKIRQYFPDITNRDAMVISQIAVAIKKGDIRAFTAIRDTSGELPEQTVNVKNEQDLVLNIHTITSEKEN